MGGFPLKLLHSLVFWIEFYDTLVLLILIKLLIMLCTASANNYHTTARMPCMLPLIKFGEFALSMCPYDFLKHPSLS